MAQKSFAYPLDQQLLRQHRGRCYVKNDQEVHRESEENMITHQKSYRFRMEPNREQRQALNRQAGARRWVWNWALGQRKWYYAKHKKTFPAAELSAKLTTMKSLVEFSWLNDVDSQMLQQVLKDLDRAFVNFFEKRARFPKFKSRKHEHSRFRMPQRVWFENGKVRIPKIGLVKIRQSQEIEGETKSATFKQDACGHWFVAVVSHFEMPNVVLPKPKSSETVGIDAGLIDFAVLSNGERVETPKFYRKAQRKLRRAQKALNRRVKGSNRRQKAKVRVAKIHQEIADKRKDFLHKLSTKLIRKFGCICIEDLCIKGLARTKLAKSFMDAGHGTFRSMLEYKAEWNLKTVVKVDRFYPSTKMCFECGRVNKTLELGDRVWSCPGCGSVLDRDLNAALNIKEEGLRTFAVGHTEKRNARGVDVRPSRKKGKAADVEARIPCL